MSNHITPILCTAGAIPYKNEKGQISMKKVKVSRYIAGKAPEHTNNPFEINEDQSDSRDIESDHSQYKVAFPDRVVVSSKNDEDDEIEVNEDNQTDDMDENMDDPRIRRLYQSNRTTRVEMLDDSESETEEDRYAKHIRERQAESHLDVNLEDESDGDEEENEEEIARRRQIARENALANEKEAILPDMIESISEDSIEYSDEYETDSDNEREPKLKPVYVKPTARLTIYKTKEELQKEREKEKIKALRAEEQNKITKKMIEEVNRQEIEESRTLDEACDAISSDIENETEEYELWKVRELKRMKRDRQEKEQSRKDKEDILRIRNMTEKQRQEEFKSNPKKVTNQQIKGKLKYMQKYYHRGAYYITGEEEEVLQRDFTAPTLEDNFNVTNLPLIKQVKNFGKAGRTKYTHLVDQDTTDYESGWANSNLIQNFYNNKAGGTKQVFEKPYSSTTKK